VRKINSTTYSGPGDWFSQRNTSIKVKHHNKVGNKNDTFYLIEIGA
jgi:hypothetical protein